MDKDVFKNKSLSELLAIINNKYGQTRGNDLVYREAFVTLSKNLNREELYKLKKEAALKIINKLNNL